MTGRQPVERWNEYIARNLRERLGAAGSFIVSCSCSSEDECRCFLGRTFAWCESDALCGQYAQHEVGGALLCTSCRDHLRAPARGVPSAGELDAELAQIAGAGQ